MRVANGRMLAVFDNDSIHHNLPAGRRDCVPTVELRHRLRLTSVPAQLVQRRLGWFGDAERRPEGELIRDLYFHQRHTTLKEDMEPLFGPRVFDRARWRKDWMKVSSELAQDRQAWSTSIRDVVMPAQSASDECRHKYK